MGCILCHYDCCEYGSTIDILDQLSSKDLLIKYYQETEDINDQIKSPIKNKYPKNIYNECFPYGIDILK